MRLDHQAFRVKDRFETATFFTKEPFNYRIQTEFEIKELCTFCLVLNPPEKTRLDLPFFSGTFLHSALGDDVKEPVGEIYHMAPDIFISSSPDENSPVGQWVKERNNRGGVHHLAFNCDNVFEMMEKLKKDGWEFTTDKPIVDDDLVQVFSKPIPVLGDLIIEFISRPSERGFSLKSVRDLMTSTKS